MNKFTYLLLTVALVISSDFSYCQNAAPAKKAAVAKADGKANSKKAVARRPKKKRPKATPAELAIELENTNKKMVIEIKKGGIYIDGDMLATVVDAKNENHKIIINPRPGEPVVKQPVDGGYDHKAVLGVFTDQWANDSLGARVMAVKRNGPAADAGLQIGDLITMINSRTIHNSQDLSDAVSDHNSGEIINITFDREGHEMHTEATLQENMPRHRYENNDHSYADNDEGNGSEWQKHHHGLLHAKGGRDMEFAPEMGISAKNDDRASGVKVLSVKPNSPAEDADLQRDDIIIRFDNVRIYSTDDLEDVLEDIHPNQKVKVEFRRDGETKSTHVHFSKSRMKKDF